MKQITKSYLDAVLLIVISIGLVSLLVVSILNLKVKTPSGIGPVADGVEYGKDLADLNK